MMLYLGISGRFWPTVNIALLVGIPRMSVVRKGLGGRGWKEGAVQRMTFEDERLHDAMSSEWNDARLQADVGLRLKTKSLKSTFQPLIGYPPDPLDLAWLEVGQEGDVGDVTIPKVHGYPRDHGCPEKHIP